VFSSGRRRSRHLIRIALSVAASLALATGTVLAAPLSSTAQQAEPSPAAADKIRPDLQATLDSDGSASFWIRFADQADLTSASEVTDWVQRGQAVADALRETAQASQAGAIRQLSAAGADYQPFWATNAIFVEDGPAELAVRIAGRPEVAGLYAPVRYDLVEPAPGQAQATVDAIEWGIANINADDVWSEFGVHGEGITVANIDTGVQYDHPALVGQYRGNNGEGRFDHSYNWFDASGICGGAPCDFNGHGTHTMGTMVGDDGSGNQIGVASGANWISANGCCASDATLWASAQWMLEPTDLNGANPDAGKRPHIVNNSWGTTRPSTDPFMEDILVAWEASGILGVWSNGNHGTLGCNSSGAPGSRTINYSVGAYDADNAIAYFSSRGPGQDDEIKPNISAPGVDVRSSLPGNTYGAFSGTSMAAPHVAGSVALLWSAAPALIGDLANTRSLLDGTAVDTEDLSCGGTAEDNNVYGEGRLDALALLRTAPVGDVGTLAGAVTDADTGEPVSGVTITIAGAIDRTITTGADGTYSTRLTAGDYTVTASVFGYASQTAPATVAVNQTTTRDFSLQVLPTVAVTGRVTDGSGHGWPLYAEVSAEGTPVSAYTDPTDGTYTLHLPAGASYTVVAEAQYTGYQRHTATVDTNGGDLVHDVAMGVDVETCDAPGYQFTDGLVTEDFDGNVVPEGWTVVDNVDTGMVWRFDDPLGRGNLTGGDGGFATVESNIDGASEDTELVSPVIDLSSAADPVIRFNQDFNWYPYYGEESADVDVSVDGGATWQTVLHQTDDVPGPRIETIRIPQAAGEPDVRVRFHYYGGWWEDWWQVDNVGVGICSPVHGGLVIGHVRDLNTGSGVNQAAVTETSDPDVTTRSIATPADPGLDDGFYWLFSSGTGSQELTAAANRYANRSETVDVAPDAANVLDISLPAGKLTVDPAGVEASLAMGGTATRTVTITNDGTAPAEVTLVERPSSFEILRADGTRMNEAQTSSGPGAPVSRAELDATTAELMGSTIPGSLNTGAAEPVPSAMPWTSIPNLSRTIWDNNVVATDGKVYSLGGSDGFGPLPDVYAYDVAARLWSRLPDMPEPLQQSAEGVIDGKIYIAGGWNPYGETARQTLVYDPAGGRWSAGADMPAAVAAAASVVFDGQLYVVGGCTTGSCDPMSSDVFRYDPGSDSWTQLADYPVPITYQSCGAIGGSLYCAGGLDGTGTPITGTYAYDPDEDRWTRLADMPVNLWGSAYSAANDRLLISGGLSGPSTVTNEGYAYDPATDRWSGLPASNQALFRAGSTCGLYKIGGSTGFGLSSAAEVLPGYDRCGRTDVPWLTIDPLTSTLQPGDSMQVTVTLDGHVTQPGTYSATIKVGEDTPYAQSPLGVAMHVAPPSDWGTITGTVTAVDCAGTQSPRAGALVQLDGTGSDVVLTTGPDGTYAYWLSKKDNPVTVIVSRDGFQAQTTQVRINPRRPVVEDFTLRQLC
jgi:subtilisin family serine protease